MVHLLDLTGQTFSLLTVIRKAGHDGKGSALWLCRCACGRYHTVRSDHLRNDHTRSCGCAKGKMISETKRRRKCK